MSFIEASLLNTNPSAAGGEAFGIKDPSNRPGWYFINDQAGKKINWYFFDSSLIAPLNITLPNFSAFAVVTLDSIASKPYMDLYSKPTGSGDIIPGFAKSSRVYTWPTSHTPVIGTKYLIYFGQNPNIYNDLERVELVAGITNGTFAPTEQVSTVAFSTDSGASINNVQLVAERLGINTTFVKATIELLLEKATFGFSAESVALIETNFGSVENYLRLRNLGQV